MEMKKEESNPVIMNLKRTEPSTRRRRNPEDPVKAMGVGLRTSEWMHFEEIARQLGLSTSETTGMHELATWVLREFIRRYDAGEVKPPTETKVVLKQA